MNRRNSSEEFLDFGRELGFETGAIVVQSASRPGEGQIRQLQGLCQGALHAKSSHRVGGHGWNAGWGDG